MSVSSLNRVPPAPVVRTCKFAVIESVPIPILPSDWMRSASAAVLSALTSNFVNVFDLKICSPPVPVAKKVSPASD